MYGIDVGDDVLMESRSWRWFKAKVEGLFALPPTGFVQVSDPADPRQVLNRPVYRSRLQEFFSPPIDGQARTG